MGHVATLESAVDEAVRLLGLAREKGVVLRALGGAGVYLRCPSARSGILARSYGDLDFVGHAKQSSEIRELFLGQGYSPSERFNALQGGRRLAFIDHAHGRRVDVFLDVFEMSHKLDLRKRMELEDQTIPLADLLATKLQVVQINQKDVADSLCLLIDHEVGAEDSREGVNGDYIARLCGVDWGVYKTFTINLAVVKEAAESWEVKDSDRRTVIGRVGQLVSLIEGTPKSLRWKVRASVGERVRWYELPEEVALDGEAKARQA